MLLIYVAWILVLLLVLIILRTVLSLIGSQLPDEHLTEVVRDLPIALDDAFRVMRDLETWQSWSYYCSARLGNYHSEFSGPRVGLGQVWRWRGNQMSGHMEIRQEWYGMRLLTCVVWDAIPESNWNRIEFVQYGGLCRIIWQTYGDLPADPLQRVWQVLLGPRMLNRAKKQSLAGLQAFIEESADI